MGKKFLIDSNTVIDYLNGKLPESGMAFVDKVIDDIAIVSVITKIEVMGFNTHPLAQAMIADFIEAASVLNLTDDIVNKTIELRTKHKFKLPDAVIAATALVNGLSLLTRNVNDFSKIKNLKIVNPWE